MGTMSDGIALFPRTPSSSGDLEHYTEVYVANRDRDVDFEAAPRELPQESSEPTPRRSRLGLSEVAEERWQRLMQRTSWQGFGVFGSGGDVATTGTPEEANSQLRPGVTIAFACPSQAFLEAARHPDAPPLPPSMMRFAEQNFVPPDGEEWHLVNGFYVRIPRSELDRIMARADAIDNGEEDSTDSGASGSTRVGSDREDDDPERTDNALESCDERD
eukprot:TRINITY_DN78094_c0_g1_i1.p1 TRINITY_DN78094_c0_g1~~TRINITY_DN78094_c0_g1_i1.p1  ORF type:complete len:227 (+),score=36.61 TRINITY_DN78094_c0_g1_i1:33-683(+)